MARVDQTIESVPTATRTWTDPTHDVSTLSKRLALLCLRGASYMISRTNFGLIFLKDGAVGRR